jgi:hypothetical protein
VVPIPPAPGRIALPGVDNLPHAEYEGDMNPAGQSLSEKTVNIATSF